MTNFQRLSAAQPQQSQKKRDCVEKMEMPYIMTALMLAVKMVQFAMCILCNCPCFMYDAGNSDKYTTQMVYWCFINVAKCT